MFFYFFLKINFTDFKNTKLLSFFHYKFNKCAELISCLSLNIIRYLYHIKEKAI
jgi:hypothetical protein